MPHPSRRHPAAALLPALLLLAACGDATGRLTSPRPGGGPSRSSAPTGPYTLTRVSGAGPVGSTDPANRFYDGTGWVDAFIVAPLFTYAAPIAGTHYIGETAGSDQLPPGTTTYRATFSLPAGYTSPVLTISVHADNYATIRVNGNLVGGHPLNQSYPIQNNFQDPPETFSTSNAGFFATGSNVLDIDLTNVGSTLTGTSQAALDYHATIQFWCAVGTYRYGRCLRAVKYVVVDSKGWPATQVPLSDSTTRVAVLGSDDFGVETIDPGSVAFAGAPALPGDAALADVNGDGIRDQVFSFDTRSLKLPEGDSEACVTGTAEKVPFEGCGTVTVVR